MSIGRFGLVRTALAVCVVLLLTSGVQAPAQPAPWIGLVVTANGDGHSISVVDAARWKVRKTLHLSVAPHNVQASADRRFLYVTANGAMSGMNMEMMEPGYVLAFDMRHLDAGPVFSLNVGMHAAHVIVDGAGRFAYVTVAGENAVKVIDLRSKAIAATIPVGKMPHGLRMSADGKRVYVSDMDDNAVSFIDVAQRKEIARVPAGKTPTQVAVAPDGGAVYATLAGDNAVAVVDVASEKTVATIPVGPNPAQLYISPDGKRLYVANQGTKTAPGHTVSVIDTASRTVASTVEVPGGAHGVVVTPDGMHVFVTNAFAAKLTEIDADTLRVRTIGVGGGPNGVTLER